MRESGGTIAFMGLESYSGMDSYSFRGSLKMGLNMGKAGTDIKMATFFIKRILSNSY